MIVGTATSAQTTARRLRVSWWSVLVLVVAAAPRVWAALWDGGVFEPAEICETLEPAHHAAFGWGLLTREFREGSRSFIFPGLISGVWKVAALLGVRSSSGLVGIAKLGMAALSIAGVWFAMSLARRLRGERAAILTGLLVGACPPLIALGSRCLPGAASAPLVVLVAALLQTRQRRDAVLAGIVTALTLFLRYPNGLLAIAFAILLVAQQRREDARAYLLAVAGTSLVGGLVDWPAWGWPFHSLWMFVKVYTVGGRLGTLPALSPLFYSEHLASSIGLTYGLLLLGLVLAWRRARGLVLVVLFFVVAQSFARVKELDFILPVLPLAIAVAAVGLVRMLDGLGRRGLPTYVFGLACAAQMAWIARAPTRGELGFGASDWVIWHSGADYFRTIQRAASETDLCGVVFLANEPAWSGGYTYLNRSVPIFFDAKPPHLAAANYVVGSKTEKLPPGWRSIFTDGGNALYQRAGGCSEPPQDWTMNLP
jgi:hypothetical protein